MKNPLRKRIKREIFGELGKYLAIFILLIGTIGFVSGFLVADGSMLIAYDESFERYNIEDGNFTTENEANKAQHADMESHGISVYENFYVEEPLTNGSTIRIFKNRTEVNLVCVMSGRLPESAGEIAIDRMYADNNELSVGDTITEEAGDETAESDGENSEEAGSGARTWTITGLVALSDYSALFSNNSDTMFDAVKFGVGVVSAEEFASYSDTDTTWCYSWKYNSPPVGEQAESDAAEDLMSDLAGEVSLESFIPRYENQAIMFTGEDMGSDKAMMLMLLYIIIGIMAFVFSITISNTIQKEARVIGTLRASGYTRGELVRHYVAPPVIVTIIGAVVGNILGYTYFKNLCASMYYGSYSLPTYVTVLNAEAFLLTTIVPVAMMLAINLFILTRKLRLSPLKFLRGDLAQKKSRRAFPLSPAIRFITRFRLRVIFQNIGSYIMLFVGICFANLLLMFGIGMPEVLGNYEADITDNLICNYQYILSVPTSAMNESRKLESMISMITFQSEVETDNEDAEKFTAYSLNTTDELSEGEEITLYGVEDGSRYVEIDTSAEGVYISDSYADKFMLEAGDTITLKERYDEDTYEFTVAGIYSYPGGMAVFMGQDAMNDVFGFDSGYFSGYFSDTPITDIDDEYIGTVIDIDAMTKVTRQLDVSMGKMMLMLDAFSVIIFMVLLYLLSKLIIEKNAQSISMVKIMGYSGREISRLYIVPTAILTVAFLALSLPLAYSALTMLFRYMMTKMMSGWIPLSVGAEVYIKMMIIGVLTYIVVAALEYRKIRKIPMDEALKNAE